MDGEGDPVKSRQGCSDSDYRYTGYNKDHINENEITQRGQEPHSKGIFIEEFVHFSPQKRNIILLYYTIDIDVSNI